MAIFHCQSDNLTRFLPSNLSQTRGRSSADSSTAIWYNRSTDGGASFGGIVNLSNTTATTWETAVAVSGNNVYVVWHDNTPQAGVAQFDILHRRSTNDGANFGTTVNLSKTAQASTIPAIAASNNLT